MCSNTMRIELALLTLWYILFEGKLLLTYETISCNINNENMPCPPWTSVGFENILQPFEYFMVNVKWELVSFTMSCRNCLRRRVKGSRYLAMNRKVM